MPTPKPKADFPGAFAGLRKILAADTSALVVVHDRLGDYYLNTTKLHPRSRQPLFFGAVRTGRHYVSFHLMPVYGCPELLAGLSPALKKHLQGKSCFNFTAPDAPLFAELAELTRRGRAAFTAAGYM